MKRMEQNGGGFLADSCGMGKTPTMSMYVTSNRLRDRPDLIVCPFSVLSTWEKWLERANNWDGKGLKNLRLLIYHGPKRKEMLRKLHNYDFVITTYAIISTGELNGERWGRAILDESHYIKNGLQRKAPKCAKAAFRISLHSLKRWAISATPFNNRLKDVAAQAMFVGVKPYDSPEWWKDHETSKDKLTQWREGSVIRRTKDDLLAPLIHHDVCVDPSKTEEKVVDMLRARAAEEFEAWKKARRAKNNYERMKLQGRILGLIQKLRIVSNSYFSGDGAVDAVQVLRKSAKVKRMIDDLDRAIDRDPKKGVVIFSQFTSFLNTFEQVIEVVMPGVEVSKFYGNMNKEERDEVVSEFNNSRTPRVILVSLMAGGVGLSLHEGSSTVFLSEPYYNPFAEQQAEERVHRIGQEHQVNVYRYSMKNSVESWISGLKQKKLVLASGLNLVNNEVVPVDFNFDDIAELFQTHVAFIEPHEPRADKPPPPRVVSQTKRKVRRRGPPVKRGKGRFS